MRKYGVITMEFKYPINLQNYSQQESYEKAVEEDVKGIEDLEFDISELEAQSRIVSFKVEDETEYLLAVEENANRLTQNIEEVKEHRYEQTLSEDELHPTEDDFEMDRD